MQQSSTQFKRRLREHSENTVLSESEYHLYHLVHILGVSYELSVPPPPPPVPLSDNNRERVNSER